MNQRLLGLLIVALATALPAAAQQQEGDSELQLQGSLNLATSSDFEHSGSVHVTYGRFFTDRQEWGLTVSGGFQQDGDVAGFGGPFYRYNFSTGDVVPFVGGALGAAFGEGAFGDGAQLQAEGGVRFFLDRSKAFTVAGQTYYSVDNSEFGDTFDVLFGFSVFWGD